MVLYFSATGNTAFIAKEMARRLGDDCVNLLERIKKQDGSPLYSKRPFIICAPVYVCEMPRFLADYLKKQTFTGSRDVYFLFTSGGYCGISGILAKSMFRKKGMICHGYAEFRMPRNYVASDAYPMLPPEEVKQRIQESCRKVGAVAEEIRQGKPLKARHVFLFETLITLPFNPVWSRLKYQTKDFHTTGSCISCGKCVRVCPLNNVSLKEGKPVWGPACTHCMACICSCPTEAIEYGSITQNKEKYHFEKYAHVAEELPR